MKKLLAALAFLVFCVGVFIVLFPCSKVHRVSGRPIVCDGERHLPLIDGSFRVDKPDGSVDIICANGLRFEVTTDALMVTKPSPITEIFSIPLDDFPVYLVYRSGCVVIYRLSDGQSRQAHIP